MNKQDKLKKIVKNLDIDATSRQIGDIVRLYNNFQMPLGERVSKIVSEPEEKEKFTAFLREFFEIPIKEEVGFWIKVKRFLNIK